MAIQGISASNKPTSNCSTLEKNQEMYEKLAQSYKKADQAVDSFIKNDDGHAKKEKIKKGLAAGILAAVATATVASVLIKSGKMNKLIDGVKDLFSKKNSKIENELASRAAEEAQIKAAQKAQDALIEVMQNPSGKIAKESAEVFKKALIPWNKDSLAQKTYDAKEGFKKNWQQYARKIV